LASTRVQADPENWWHVENNPTGYTQQRNIPHLEDRDNLTVCIGWQCMQGVVEQGKIRNIPRKSY
jgi:hypothetical protein